MNIILESKRDLEEAIALISWLNRPVVDRVSVGLPWLDRTEQQRSEKALKFLFNDCGCQWGTIAFLLVVAWYLAPMVQAWQFTGSIVGLSLLIGIFSALVAKLIGLGWSYWRLKILFKRLALAETVPELKNFEALRAKEKRE